MSLILDSGNTELDDKIKEFLEYCNSTSFAGEIKKLVSKGKYDDLSKIMMTRLTFGTAGLRGHMGPGYAAMNDLVVIQTSQGLSSYLKSLDVLAMHRLKGVVIGYDNRHNSKRFADLASLAFIQNYFKVYLFSNITPTPFVPYAVKKLNCLAGIMITASHNPKDENGYKVYWSNGAQILPPHDKNIQESILNNLKPWSHAFDTSLVWTSPYIFDPLSEVEEKYYADLIDSVFVSDFRGKKKLRIAFTALHGVSHAYMKKAFQKLEYCAYIAVKEQMYPDPDFPTVKFPNPEEKNCLDLSIMTANKTDCNLILANDPDADRLAVAERLPTGNWRVYSGNEIGALLGGFLWHYSPSEWLDNPEMCCMVSSAVSSKILRSIALKEGFVFYETLTGFKWMANKANEALKKGMNLVFAFEEAIGYMCGSTVLDKDGIQAAMHVAGLAAITYENNKLLKDVLRETYLKYGYHVCQNSYFLCYDPDASKAMFERLRNYKGSPNTYPDCLECEGIEYSIAAVRDLTTGFDSSQPNNKAILPTSSSTQMITFYFHNGCEATLRTSGTEPKIKYYTEMIAEVAEKYWDEQKRLLATIVNAIIEHWIQPEENGFLYRPS